MCCVLMRLLLKCVVLAVFGGGPLSCVFSVTYGFFPFPTMLCDRVTPPRLHMPPPKGILQAIPCGSLGPLKAWAVTPPLENTGMAVSHPVLAGSATAPREAEKEDAGFCSWYYHGLRLLSQL